MYKKSSFVYYINIYDIYNNNYFFMRTFFIGLKELLLNIAFIVFYIMPLCVVSAVIYLILFLLAIGVGVPIVVALGLLGLSMYALFELKDYLNNRIYGRKQN